MGKGNPKIGRPRFIETPQEMMEKAELYFKKCDKGEVVKTITKKNGEIEEIRRKIPYTVPGLCLALGFSHREALRQYESKPGFSRTVKILRVRIERQRVEKMLSGEQNTIGSIFDLKCNFGYIDNPEQHNDQHKLSQGDVASIKEIAQAWAEYKRRKLNQEALPAPQDQGPEAPVLTPGKASQPQDADHLPVFIEGELVTSQEQPENTGE